jgi:hypothetical protein
MISTVSVSLSPATLQALMEHFRVAGTACDLAHAVESAVRYWLANSASASGTPAGDLEPAAPRGYQWKTLFLPEGTWVRMAYRGDHEYAEVKGDHIMYRGRAVSPNQFALSQADSVRNAWYDLSLRFPGEKRWKRAFQLRQELEQAQPKPKPIPASTAVAPAASTAPAASITPAAPVDVAPEPRDPTPGIGWTEPERRNSASAWKTSPSIECRILSNTYQLSCFFDHSTRSRYG